MLRAGGVRRVFVLRSVIPFGSRGFAVDAELVKRLRQETRAGVMACRDALEEAKGDLEKARTILLSKGPKSREGKVAAEGAVAVGVERGWGVAVEICCETDFVARGTSVGDLGKKCVSLGLEGRGGGGDWFEGVKRETLGDLEKALRATGEKMEMRRGVRVGDGTMESLCFSYAHAPSGVTRVGTVVALKKKQNTKTTDDAQQVGARLAVHVTAMKPRDRQELLQQPFGAMGSQGATVEQVLQRAGLELLDFGRLEVGEGIEKPEEVSFADQVKAALKQ